MSKVYFTRVNESDKVGDIQEKLSDLIDRSDLFHKIMPGDKAVLKMHFGEKGNKGFVKPEYVKIICDHITDKQVEPILSDTNTLYKGKRIESEGHLEIAREHGFTKENTGAKVVIPADGKDNNIEIYINRKYINSASISRFFSKCDALIGVAHFKGHMMTGFGGTLKNIGMGCASREGKLAQHTDIAPIVYKAVCVGCGSCERVCPVGAISTREGKAILDKDICIGCASCLAACNYNAMGIDWASGGDTIQEKMVEYAKAVLDSNQGVKMFFNFAVKITKECDCLAGDDPRIVPDIGIFLSEDPVSIDKACLDMSVKAAGRDIFREVHPERDGMKQLLYASDLGLGELEYELVEVNSI